MYILQYSDRAEADLAKMFDYGAVHWGVDKALLFLDNFFESLEILTFQPKIGRVEGQNRVFNFSQYRVDYKIEGHRIFIITVSPKGRPD